MVGSATAIESSPLSHRICSISVTGGFLDGARFELADGLNCFIGARGTGKTTILEFVRFALASVPGGEADLEERRRIESLVQANLGGGRVEVEIQTKEGLTYIVSRAWGEEPVVLSAERKPTQLTLKTGGVFRADIYSQNEVERIADRSVSQLVLIDNFEPDALAEISVRLRETNRALSANASQITPLEQQEAELREEIATLPEVEEKLTTLGGAAGGASDAVNLAHAHKAMRDRETRAIAAVEERILGDAEQVEALIGNIGQAVKFEFEPEILKGPNGHILTEVLSQLVTCGDAVDALLVQLRTRLNLALKELGHASENVTVLHDQQELAFRELIEQHESDMEQATERVHMEILRNDLLEKTRIADNLAIQIQSLRTERATRMNRLSDVRDERFALRGTVANRINDRLSPSIKVSIVQYGDRSAYQAGLETALKGSGMKHKIVAQKIAAALPPPELAAIVQDHDSASLSEQAGINADQADKVIDALNSTEGLFALEAVELLDQPTIELKDGSSYKESPSLSKGQKCTSILPILLLDSDRPLLVDQPEDNLDNAFIYETVVKKIGEIKQHRQLIFVTHNPNIPVLGEADKVFVLKSDGAKAWTAAEGTVDECREEIISLLEGGEEAFKLRQKRYLY